MSLKILVVEKDHDSLQKIVHMAKEYKNTVLVISCRSFVKALKLLENEVFDIVFIDTDLMCTHVYWGIKIIYKKLNDIKIILISSTVVYLDIAFDTPTAGYILKPVCGRNILKSIERVEKSKNVIGFKGVIVKQEDKEIFLSYNEIIFIEAANRKSMVHTLKHEYPVCKNIKDFLKEIPSDIFVQSHRSYIINITKIKFIEKFNNTSYNVVFSKEKIALMSRRHIKDFKSMLSAYS